MPVNPFVERAIDNYLAGHITLDEVADLVTLATINCYVAARGSAGGDVIALRIPTPRVMLQEAVVAAL